MPAPPSLLHVGTYSEPIRFASGKTLAGGGRGIHLLHLDEATGTLAEAAPATPARNASYLAYSPDRRFLYAVNELKEPDGTTGGHASAFAIDAQTGQPIALNSVPTHGADPCHLAIHPTGRHAVIANYSSGHITVLPIGPDGTLGPASHVIAHTGSSIHPVRQTGPHPHHIAINAAGTHVFVTDLGLDRIMIYRFDSATGTLNPDDPPFTAVTPGAGPRQTVRHPHLACAYVLNELGSSITICAYDAATARLSPGQTVASLPAGFSGQNTCAEAQVAPSGRFFYASNRGHDSIATFAIAPTSGDLTLLGHIATGGTTPRNFDLSPAGNFLAAANQDSGSVVLFRVDAATGALTPTGSIVELGMPVCVRFL